MIEVIGDRNNFAVIIVSSLESEAVADCARMAIVAAAAYRFASLLILFT